MYINLLPDVERDGELATSWRVLWGKGETRGNLVVVVATATEAATATASTAEATTTSATTSTAEATATVVGGTATTTVTEVTATTGATTRTALRSEVDANLTTVEVVVVHVLDGLLSIGLLGVGDETESTGATSIAVDKDLSKLDVAFANKPTLKISKLPCRLL
jgi:hypothetical protein